MHLFSIAHRGRARMGHTAAEVHMENRSAVFGIYRTNTALEAAVEALRSKGFRSADISVLSASNPAFAEVIPVEPGAPASGPSGASSVGATLGWLAGLSALAMASGVFVVAGPVMLAMAQMGEAAATIAGA